MCINALISRQNQKQFIENEGHDMKTIIITRNLNKSRTIFVRLRNMTDVFNIFKTWCKLLVFVN